ncbi:hypothetical protein ACLOJK_009921 [Asimina triloba]
MLLGAESQEPNSMALNLGLPGISHHSHPSQQHLFKTFNKSGGSSALLLLLLSRCCSSEISAFKNIALSSSLYFRHFHARASLKGADSAGDGNPVSELLDDDLLRRVATVKNADEALQMIEEGIGRNEGVVGTSDCCLIIQAALDGGNTELALSVFEAMRSSFDQEDYMWSGVGEQESSIERWKWARPDAHTCAALVRGLAGALRVSEAIRMIAKVSRMGASPGEEETRTGRSKAGEIEQGAQSLEGSGEECSDGRIRAEALPVGGIEQGDRELEALKARERRAPAGRDAHRRCRRKETSNEDGERKMRGKGDAAAG